MEDAGRSHVMEETMEETKACECGPMEETKACQSGPMSKRKIQN
jgi:hypothetical protein